jgi:hypothetical protein
MDELLSKLRENDQEEIYDEYDDLSEFDDAELSISNNNQNDFIQFKQYNVYCYFNINKDISFIFPIKTDLFYINKQYIYDLIKNVVKKINNEKIVITYNSTKCIISLKDIEEDENIDFYTKNYEIKPCKKKNFMPKYDSPSYSSYSLLNNIGNENISFILKNPLNIMLREKYEINEDENKLKYNIDDEFDY